MLNDHEIEGDRVPETESIQRQLKDAVETGAGPKITRFIATAASGAVPLFGGLIGGAAHAWSEAEQERINRIFQTWMKLQEDEIREIGVTLAEVLHRVDVMDEAVQERLKSPEFLSLLKKCFREWSAAESEEKRILIRNLLSNAAACTLCSDDIIRLFIEWIGNYSEAHFKVIRTIYQHPYSTRRQIWLHLHGADVREDSAEADLFKLLIRDLSTGQIVRQHREVDRYGNFVKQKPQRGRQRSGTLTSAFEDEKEYVLTELGKQFVHYTMNEIVPRLAADAPATS